MRIVCAKISLVILEVHVVKFCFVCFPFWGCRQNAIRLEEKEKREKEIRSQIIEEGEEYKKAFYEKRNLNIETNKTTNREKEKVKL